MTAMVRLVIDVPADTRLVALHRIAEETGGRLYRRADGTFLIRTSNPTAQPAPRDAVSGSSAPY